MIRPSRLQTSYQRNYLIGMAVALLLSCLLAIVIKLTDHFSPGVTDSISLISDTCIVYTDNPGHPGKDKIFMHEPAYLPDGVIQDLNVSDMYFGGGDYYPGNYWDNDFGYGSVARHSGTEDINCPLEVIKKQLPEFPGIARIDEKEGFVEVLVHIDIHGRVTPFSCQVKDSTENKLEFFVDDEQNDLVFVIFKEDPKGYYFAKNLIDVLPGWVFKPQIEHGVPVDVFVRVKLRYCFYNNEDCRGQQVEFEVL